MAEAERSASAPNSPTDIFGLRKGRRVNFPTDDLIVSSYCEAPLPQSPESDSDNPVKAYKAACAKQGVPPLEPILKLLEEFEPFADKEYELYLKGEDLSPLHCETLEEVFKRIHFKLVCLESCGLTDEGASAIFDMIEYYESTDSLDINSNVRIENRGWQACCKMLKKCPNLQYLDCRFTSQNDQTLLILGRALRTGCHLVKLNLEHCHLGGRPLVILVAALKLNITLKELYVGYNEIQETDGIQIGTLLKSNSVLELLDLRSNNIQDLGTSHIVDGLVQQLPAHGIKFFILQNNNLSSSAMKYFSRALDTSSVSLNSINIGENHIGNIGLHQIKKSLTNNNTLSRLELRNCGISCDGAVTLAEALTINKRLQHIDLRGNNVELPGLMALSLALKHNSRLSYLLLDPFQTLDKNFEDIISYEKLYKEISDSCTRNIETNKLSDLREVTPPVIVSVVHHPPEERPRPFVQVVEPAKPKSRFQVSKVVLDTDPPQPSSVIKPCIVDAKVVKPEQSKKRLAFLLPELPSSPHRVRKDRRMSTPAIPISGPHTQRLNLNLKFCKQLESLDLRSSVPLSPTRLLEAWEFPEPTGLPEFPNFSA